jgi:hypothetical protein
VIKKKGKKRNLISGWLIYMFIYNNYHKIF